MVTGTTRIVDLLPALVRSLGQLEQVPLRHAAGRGPAPNKRAPADSETQPLAKQFSCAFILRRRQDENISANTATLAVIFHKIRGPALHCYLRVPGQIAEIGVGAIAQADQRSGDPLLLGF